MLERPGRGGDVAGVALTLLSHPRRTCSSWWRSWCKVSCRARPGVYRVPMGMLVLSGASGPNCLRVGGSDGGDEFCPGLWGHHLYSLKL